MTQQVIIAASMASCAPGTNERRKHIPPCHSSPDHDSRQYSMHSTFVTNTAIHRLMITKSDSPAVVAIVESFIFSLFLKGWLGYTKMEDQSHQG